MKRVCVLLSLLLLSVVSNAQRRSSKFDVESIKKDPAYYWGCSDVLDAQDKALDESINVLYNNIINNCNANPIIFTSGDPKEQLRKILTTFDSKLRLKIFQYPLVDDYEDDEYSYFSYIKKDDVNGFFNDRKDDIQRFAETGFKYEEEGLQIEDALRSYYWGMMLCLAHPHGDKLKITVDEQDYEAYNWFHDRIQKVLDSFVFVINGHDPGEYNEEGISLNLRVRCTNGNPVSNLQFKYHDGQKLVLSRVDDGKAVVQLVNKNATDFYVMIEYEFMHDALTRPDVKVVLETMDKVKFKTNVRKNIDIKRFLDELVNEDEVSLGVQDNDNDIVEDSKGKVNVDDYVLKEKDAERYLAKMQDIEKAFRSEDFSSVRNYFTKEGYGMLDTLINNGDISVVGQQQYNFIKMDDMVICRGINMNFEFKNHASFIREVVFRFDINTELVTSIAFRLSSVTEDDIHSKTVWPLDNRLVLMNFLEDYQTAYALERYDYLESIYSDDALIIVGHVVKKTEEPLPDRINFKLPKNEVTLIQSDKKQYFESLSKVFKAQEYIDIRFADTDFTRQMSTEEEGDTVNGKRGYEDIYGVRLLQEYKSSTYGDVGYLFLLVDLRKETPIIHVRAWQPDKVDLNKLVQLKDLM